MSDPEAREQSQRRRADEFAYFKAEIVIAERSLMIVLGLTATVLAGFLSQVWSSAGVAFRSELAEALKTFGVMFVASFAMPPVRMMALRPNRPRGPYAFLFFLGWSVIFMTLIGIFIVQFQGLGDVILRNAKLPST